MEIFMSKKWKAILFDMDGTITDTEKIYNYFWNGCAKALGMTEFTYQDSLDLRSLNAEDSAKLLHDRHGDSVDYEKLHVAVGDCVKKYLREHPVPLKPGINELLSSCRKTGLKTVVVTATNLPAATERLKSAGLYDDFDDLISAHEAKRGKPYPEPYLLAAERLGLTPEECLAVEDSPNGCMSAINAGMDTIMVPDLTEPDTELKKKLFAAAKSLSDIIPIITCQDK